MSLKIDLKEARAPLTRNLAETFVPLAQLLADTGLGHREISEAYKLAMVEAAKRKLWQDGFEPSKSRIALVCNLTRSEVARLIEPRRSGTPPIRPSKASQILSEWNRNPRWCGENGPLDLPYSGIRSFCELCEGVSRRVHPRTVLDEFEANENVEVLDNGLIRFKSRAVMASEDLDRISQGLRNTRALLETIAANYREHNTHLELLIWSDSVPASRMGRLQKTLKDKLRRIQEEIVSEIAGVEVGQVEFDTVGVGLYQIHKPRNED